MTHAHQTVESYEALAFTKDRDGFIDGSAKVEVTVLNDWSVSVKTFGVNRDRFTDLKNDVIERLEAAGYNADRLSIEL